MTTPSCTVIHVTAPGLRTDGAPFENHGCVRGGELIALAAERRRPLPRLFDDPEERGLDDEPAWPRPMSALVTAMFHRSG